MAKMKLGLDKYTVVMKTHGTEAIIAKSREIHDEIGITMEKAYEFPWLYYGWLFGNAWRDMYREMHNNPRVDIAATFELHEVLSTEQLGRITTEFDFPPYPPQEV